ncbi:hypothetical protein H5410_040125 [Solanum commersonii]|uniref:Uncharacterized protein n=1 Tax=Solanum commersonii TaxID=4109 RepID=A0A9J5XMZ7_SOLCO|nr:hypothetical protein H5410_040125 [Solanum commersonii]
MEVPSSVEAISVILATEYWGIFLLRDRKFFPAIKVIPSEPLMQSREDTANKVLQDTGALCDC